VVVTTEFCLVLSTCPDEDAARSLARGLVAERLAACVNIVPGLLSVYRWQGEIDTASEHLLVIKTESAAFEAVKSYLRRHHPYELPEIVAVPIGGGSPEYLDWLSACLRPESAS
jgi:periplasmic divalent cation tolerance protein